MLPISRASGKLLTIVLMFVAFGLNAQIIPDSLKVPPPKIDSLRGRVSENANKIDNKIDSIASKPDAIVSDYNSRITSLQNKLTHRIDSLKKLPDADPRLLSSLDSMRTGLDSLKTSITGKGQEYFSKADGAASRINEKISSVENKVNGNLGKFNANGGNVPTLDLPGVNTPSVKGLAADTGLPEIPNMPSATPPGVDLKTDGLNLPATDLKVDGFDQIKNPLDIPEGKLADVVPDKVTDKVGDIGEIKEQAGGYVNDTKAIAKGELGEVKELPGAVEKKLGNLDEVKELQKQTGDYSGLTKNLNSDPEAMKEMAMKAAKQQAVNHFEGHMDELNAAMNKLSALKAKQKDAETVKELFSKRSNAMARKSFRERILTGFNIQIQASNHQWIDFNPFVGYRWTTRWTTGIGWNERLAMDIKNRTFVPREHVFGPRSFVEFKIKEGIHARAEAEYMNSPVLHVPGGITAPDPSQRRWVWSYMAGLKKSFAMGKGWKGNAQVLYNLYNPDRRSPYMNRLNIRMGFELPAMKPKKRAGI